MAKMNPLSYFRISRVGPAACAILCALSAAMTHAATPPARVNYQGVLRDPSSGTPMSGAYDAVFRFYSAPTAGDEILVDTHSVIDNLGLSVTNGLFNVPLGGGVVTDGAGPGTYAGLDEAFRDYGTVWLEIEIQGQVLQPRVNVVSSPYALNATNLNGKPASSFLDTSETFQFKSGPVLINATTQPAGFAIQAVGPGGGLVAYDSDGGSGFAEAGTNDYGIRSYGRWGGGTGMAGWFKETTASGEAWLAPGDNGLIAFGSNAGGLFRRGTPSFYSDQASIASGGYGVDAFGEQIGGRFRNPPFGGGEALLASQGHGVSATGAISAGYFHDPSNAVEVWLARNDFTVPLGLHVLARTATANFENSVSPTFVVLANQTSGGGTGVISWAGEMAGEFYNHDEGSWAALADNARGVSAWGYEYGAHFQKWNPSAGLLSDTYVGNYWGVEGAGALDYGAGGGQFRDMVYSGHAQLGRGDAGVIAYGGAIAGIFAHGSETSWDVWTHLADGTSSIVGNGAKNFVQNHPYDPAAEIVYTALEGDEVGTYTRGSAVLEQGIARVKLSPSFAWVTNPDIGLTATVTPRGEPVPLAVESVSTSELVVRAEAGARDVAFDYLVQGLRIGFERASVVRPKRGDAPIPPMKEHTDVYAVHPGMKEYTALSRFEAMQERSGDGKGIDLSRSEALVTAIGVADMSRPPARRHSLLTPEHAAQWERDHPGESLAEFEARPSAVGKHEEPVLPTGPPRFPAPAQGSPASAGAPERAERAAAAAGPRAPRLGTITLAVAEAVEPGDVLVNDAARPGAFVRAREAGDRGVIGIVTGDPGMRYLTEAPLALAGMVVSCKVDATEAPIEANDLLMASSLAGHAMRAGENPRQGTVIGKALEPLSEGTGVIKVLVLMGR